MKCTEENKRVLFCMLLFGALGYLIMINMFNLQVKSALVRAYVVMSVPCGMKVLRKIQPDLFDDTSVMFSAMFTPIILILASVIGIFETPIFIGRLIFQKKKSCV